MSLENVDSADGGAIDLERKRSLNPWLILGVVLFVVAFILGWRKVSRKKTDAGGDELPDPESQPS